MRVAAVLNRLPPHLAPPADDREIRAQPVAAGGVHLEHASSPGCGAQDGADLGFVVSLDVRWRPLGPVALRIIEVSERFERLPAVDHGQDLAQVLPGRRRKVEAFAISELARINHVSIEPDAVDRA